MTEDPLSPEVLARFTRLVCECGQLATVGTYKGALCHTCAALLPRVCDFCDDLKIKWMYPARGFDTGERVEERACQRHQSVIVTTGSEGAWAACTACHDFIEAGEWTNVALRASADCAHAPFERALIVAELLELYTKFRQHRIGPAIPLSPEIAAS